MMDLQKMEGERMKNFTKFSSVILIILVYYTHWSIVKVLSLEFQLDVFLQIFLEDIGGARLS